MKKVLALASCALAVAGLRFALLWGHPEGSFRGFFPPDAAREAEVEKTFRAVPTPEQARQDLWTLTQTPHVASTPEDYRAAQFVLNQFHEAGLEASIAEYRVYLPMPRHVEVDLVSPRRWAGPTVETESGANPQPGDPPPVIPAFNAYSPSCDLTAPVVYANYGLPEDYRRLKEFGVDVAGKIVIVRYGKCFRGVKAYVAEEQHAAGLLIYSDPGEDGYRRGDVFPRGPWRPASAVQRGSILYLTSYAGDPLTPGVAATRDARRINPKDSPTLPHIPTTPLSYQDATPILENLTGPVAPASWQGALPFTYHLGPGTSRVHLKLEMDFRERSIWDVIARIPGSVEPDAWVVLGNHRDAWTYGAADPSSGTAPLLAVGRGLGRLLQQGWRPRRTMVLASWDAEEFGLIGSTEWVEDHAGELARSAVAYLNMDVGVSGPHFTASAVPSLRALIREAARDITDPNTGRDLYSVWSEEGPKLQREEGIPGVFPAQVPGLDAAPAHVGDLGGGSDFTPFLQHLGIASMDLGFGGPYGVYHAADDNFYWMEHFGDPSFRYSVVAAQVFGTLGLRMADADILPFDYSEYGEAIQKYVRDLVEELKQTNQGDKLPLDGVAKAAARFTETAHNLEPWMQALAGPDRTNAARQTSVNDAFKQVERDFLLPQGLPNRAWFRHAFYAPGVYTGYAAVIMPGVREAIRQKDWATAEKQARLLQEAIERGTATLSRALELLGGAGPGRAGRTGH